MMADRLLLRHRLVAYDDDQPTTNSNNNGDMNQQQQQQLGQEGETPADGFLTAGTFHLIVQEQAKSMVAIQELQQEVGSLLLFRQAVLAALPHLQQSTPAVAKSSAPPVPHKTPPAVSWTTHRRRQQHHHHQFKSLEQQQQSGNAGIGAAVVDSGFSTDNQASTTSPRSSRFSDTSADYPAPPVDKELIQHLERVRQRLNRLKKDEDRLLNLLSAKKTAHLAPEEEEEEEEPDELWLLLDEIQWKSQDLKQRIPPPIPAPLDGSANKKRVSFQEEELQEPEAGGDLAREEKSGVGGVGGAGGGWRNKKKMMERERVAAILRLTNPVELQRHLLRALVDNQTLSREVECGRAEVATLDAEWRSRSQSAAEQMATLRDENEDLRFQLEEQKIELEGTKARLRMINSRHSIPPSANSALSPPPLAKGNTATPPPPLTISSVRCRAASTQTEATTKWPTTPPARHPPFSRHSATTQTEDKMAATSASSRILPRVIDASPKPKSFNGGNGGSGNAGFSFSHSEEDGDRPSRIPTPIKPSNHHYNNNNNNNKMASPHTKRELPHLPAPAAIPPATAKTPPLRGAASKVRNGTNAKLKTRLAFHDTNEAMDYYDSINPTMKQRSGYHGNNHSSSSPNDSLERSFPSATEFASSVSRQRRCCHHSSGGSSTSHSLSVD